MARQGRVEKYHEKKYTERVRSHPGYDAIKLGAMGPFLSTGDPDRLTVGPRRFALLIEFKKPSLEGKPLKRKGEKKQASRHKFWRKAGYKVYVCYHWKKAYEIFKKEKRLHRILTKKISKARDFFRPK